MRSGRAALAALALLATPSPAAPVTVDALTDDRRRGLSWSEGRAAARIGAGVTPLAGVRLDAAVASLRGSRRHGGADAGVDLSATVRRDMGAVQIDAGVVAHVFAGGRGPLDYAEVQAGARTLIGPLDLDAYAAYAPAQRAIGGDNLYLGLRGRVAVVGTPYTLVAGIGRSSGDADDRVRAARLRPGGAYLDWQIGAEHVRGRLALGIFYTGTDIGAAERGPARHAGDAVTGRLTLTL
ncbi:MAG: TorF family putative porin [Sphingomonas sp.]